MGSNILNGNYSGNVGHMAILRTACAVLFRGPWEFQVCHRNTHLVGHTKRCLYRNNFSSKIMINFKQRKAFWNVPSVPVRGVDPIFISTAGTAEKLSLHLQEQKNDIVGTKDRPPSISVLRKKRHTTNPALDPPPPK